MPGRRKYGELPTLPPMEFWRDPTIKKNSIETPLDARNLVDLDGVLKVVDDFISPDFNWASPMNDIHHLQWSVSTQLPDSFTQTDYYVLLQFRGLVNRMMKTGRVRHNMVHWLMAPPPIPDVEVMQNCIDAQRVAVSLSRTASLATRLTRISAIKQRDLDQRLEEEFFNYNLYMENARTVPEEFSLLRLEELEVRSPEDLLVVNKELGRLALDVVPIRTRVLRQAA